MHAHCLQHVPFEGMASIESWLKDKNFEITYTRLYENTSLPEPDKIDWLIIMGGPMSVNDETAYPWLVKEKEFIRKCIEKGKVVIGICLGAQLIASALGSKIFKNQDKEIGWFPINLSESGDSIFNNFPKELTVYHWHGETFNLPDGARLIASSEACRNQVFMYNNKVIGFQCHLETTEKSLEALIENCKNEIVPAKYIQSIEEMHEGYGKYVKEMRRVLFGVLEKLL